MTDLPAGEPMDVLRREREALQRSLRRALKPHRWARWRPWVDAPAMALLLLVTALALTPPHHERHAVPALDAVAPESIRADRDLRIEDQRATALLRETAAAEVLPVFRYDSELYFTLGEQVGRAVQEMQRRKREGALSFAERRAAFEADLGVPAKAAHFELVEGVEEPGDLKASLGFLLNIALDRMVVADRGLLPADGGVDVRDVALDREAALTHLGAILDLRQIRRLMQARAGDAPYGSARPLRSWIADAAQQLARPNLIPDPAATTARRQAAADAVEPAFLRVRSGEVVLRAGDRVTPQAQERIRMLNEAAAKGSGWAGPLASAGLAAALAALAAAMVARGGGRRPIGRKPAYLLAVIVALNALLAVAAWYGGLGLAEGLNLDPKLAPYFVPIALVAALGSLLVDARSALIAGFCLAVLVALRVDGDLTLVAYYLVGLLAAAIAVRGCRRRTDLLRAGLVVAAAQAAVAPLAATLAGEPFGFIQLPVIAAAAISGGLVAAGALCLLPALESVFGESTDLRLLELASADHPVMKRLALLAPGSYHASVIVANLCEAAADAIGASGLKARVMALYHDIGKLVRPAYFAENQRDGNLHDRLSPQASAAIVFAHVKDGLEIARKERLGRVVMEGIAQHQGTTLLRVFHHKALDQAERTGGATVVEADFRYPGPKPSSTEAGILHLADSVEAATRSLRHATPAEVRRKVTEVVGEKIVDGQLDECDLTLRDLSAVEEAFARTLTLGVFHNRVEYPAPRRLDAGEEGNGANRAVHRLPGLGRRSA